MASSKNTGLTLTLVFFVIISLVSGVLAVMMYQENQEGLAQWQADQKKYTDADQLAKGLLEDVQNLKKILGHDLGTVGTVDADPEGGEETVIGALMRDMKDYAGDLEQKTVSATLEKMHTELVEVREQLGQKQKSFEDQRVALNSLDKTQQELRQEVDDQRDKAEKLLQEIQETKESEILRKDELLAEAREQINNANSLADDRNRQLELLKKESTEISQNQRRLIRANAEKLREITNYGFKHPDGKIVWTSRDKRTVWINLGKSDRLSRGLTFSVYTKNHSGVGRGPDDIKGSIEITKIMGPHKAQARVTGTNIFLPITGGDPIYTPLWSPGRSDNFVIVGFIDLDGDGQSDRQQLRDIITESGSAIVAEILEDGTTIPEDADFNKLISTDVKFVIKGVLPDPSTTNITEEQDVIQDVLGHYQNMRNAALDNGVLIASLSDFLSHIGFKVEKRLYRPGEKRGYTLKNGSRSASVNETISRVGNQSSSGVAGKYSRHPLLNKGKATGQTSKRYGTK